MLHLDFINVGDGDAILIREEVCGQLRYAMLVDCGHDELVRPDERSERVYAGEFLAQLGIRHLDMLVLTHFHRDHIGGIGQVLSHASVGELVSTWMPPMEQRGLDLHPEENELPGTAKNVVRWLNVFLTGLRTPGAVIEKETILTGERRVIRQLTDELIMYIDFLDPCLYVSQRRVYSHVLAGVRDRYELLHWGKCMNPSSLRIRLRYHGQDVMLGGDAYAVLWENDSTTPCKILKVPHHGSLSSTTRKLLRYLAPEIAVVSVSSTRSDERPHPVIVSLLREYCREVCFTDAVSIPGLVEPAYHASVHLTLD